MFPPVLHRVPYLLRWLCLLFGAGLVAALLIPLRNYATDQSPLLMALGVLGLLVMVIKVAVLDIARMRSIGWSPWLLLLYIVPGAGVVLQILLFVAPPAKK